MAKGLYGFATIPKQPEVGVREVTPKTLGFVLAEGEEEAFVKLNLPPACIPSTREVIAKRFTRSTSDILQLSEAAGRLRSRVEELESSQPDSLAKAQARDMYIGDCVRSIAAIEEWMNEVQ